MNDTTDLIARIDKEETDLTLAQFTNDDAWWLGNCLRDAAVESEVPVAIAIHRGEACLFLTMLPGATADNVLWATRKIAVAMRFERSSYAMALHLRQRQVGFERYGLDDRAYACAGGALPLRVKGVGVVGAVAVSGLPEEDDHAMVVAALKALSTQQRQAAAAG